MLYWDTQGLPVSEQFGDIYFSKDNGLEETHHVYLAQNHLADRWQTLPQDTPQQFVIGETGFGTGLNFLAAWNMWLSQAPANAQLHFISVEKYPLCDQELSRALNLWPSLKPLTQQLLKAYPLAVTRGFHRMKFQQVLSLYHAHSDGSRSRNM